MNATPPKKPGMLQNILLGYLILVLHLFLIILIAMSTVFLEGLHRYLGWVLGVGIALVAASGWMFWRRARRNALRVGEFLSRTVPLDRPVEISFLGGVAQVRLGASGSALPPGQAVESLPAPPRIESPGTQRVQQIEKLAELLGENLITQAEFRRLKADLIAGAPSGE